MSPEPIHSHHGSTGSSSDLHHSHYSDMALPELAIIESAEQHRRSPAVGIEERETNGAIGSVPTADVAGGGQGKAIHQQPLPSSTLPSRSSLEASSGSSTLADVVEKIEKESGDAQDAGGEDGGPAKDGTHVEHEVLTKKRLMIIVFALCLCVLMAAMDQTIVTTAIPIIADQFESGSGYTWIGTAYLLMASAFLPSWGKFSDIFGRKPILLVACSIFLVGSILCAVAQNITTIIVGRAIQGMGAGGLVGLVNITISDLVPVRRRGIYLSFVGFTWAFASAIGPILGGVFTQYASWRWCFWINVPITVVAMLALLLLLHLQSPKIGVLEGLKRVDWLGSLFIITGTVLFLLGLEFGGVSHPWTSAIVLCFIIIGVFVLIGFVFVEWRLATLPIMPLRLFQHPTNIASYTCAFFHGFTFISGCYFLPLYFQAVRGSSVLLSGVSILPYVVLLSLFSAVNGFIIARTSRYQEPVWVGSVLMLLGTGLFVDLDRTSNWAKIILYQVIAGAGAGPGFQGPLIAIHSTIQHTDVGVATTAFAWLRNLATSMGICLGLVVFQNVMQKELPSLANNPAVRPEVVQTLLRGGGSGASALVPYVNSLRKGGEVEAVRDVYAQGLKAMWWFFMACAVLSGIASLGIGRHHLSTTVASSQPAKRRKGRSVEEGLGGSGKGSEEGSKEGSVQGSEEEEDEKVGAVREEVEKVKNVEKI